MKVHTNDTLTHTSSDVHLGADSNKSRVIVRGVLQRGKVSQSPLDTNYPSRKHDLSDSAPKWMSQSSDGSDEGGVTVMKEHRGSKGS